MTPCRSDSRGPAMRKLVRDVIACRRAAAALSLLLVILAGAFMSPLIAPQDPYDLTQLELMDSRLEPGAASADATRRYWLGTDEQGRDMSSAILYGLRISVSVGVASTVLALVAGLALGLLAAYHRGLADTLIMRLVDIQLSIPAILIALLLLAFSGPGIGKVVLALAAVQWAHFARLVRGVALVERNKDYFAAASGLRLSATRIMLRHLLPNCLPPLIVLATVKLAAAITLEATLSFLGLGAPVTEPSLGLLIANGYRYFLSGQYWISFFPGVALLLTVASVNVLADALQDMLNPRIRPR